jgi:hypothetical protein
MRPSDFQIPDAPMPVGARLMARIAKAAGAMVNWNKTAITTTEGARQTDPLRRYGRDSESEEPEEFSSSDEPEEEVEKAMDEFNNFLTVLTDSDTTLRNSASDVVANLKRDRARQNASADLGAATVISPRRKLLTTLAIQPMRYSLRNIWTRTNRAWKRRNS